MVRLAKAIILIAVVCIICSCATLTINKNSDNEVLARAIEFQQAQNSGNGEKIWDLSIPFIRLEMAPRDEYIRIVSLMFSGEVFKFDMPVLALGGDRWAITHQVYTATFSESEGTHRGCIETLWIKYVDNIWYWAESDRVCGYKFEKDYIESLIVR